ncbi:MAG: hypothetical protein QNJ60_19705 [Xenococcaceae cyanobacterium MO_188.B19]|nr:hypothetical protein [Xenococcaceae cyanobacterium MO_188.B19]
MGSTKAKPENKNATIKEDAAVIENSVAKDSEMINDQPQFQAVGIIKGEVKFHDDEKKGISVIIGNKEYGIECSKRNYDARSGLKKEIEKTGKTTQRLIVYPKVMHFPKKEQPHRLWFQLVGFVRENHVIGIAEKLADNEFKLCGLWQFIPVCRQPCISIFLNFKQERLDYLKKSDEPATQARFMKANHIPVLWKDSPQRPFRYNPRGGKDQGHPYFVQIKAAFLPHRDAFGFMEQLGEPIEQAPKFIKLPKPGKAQSKKKSSDQPKINQQKKSKKLILKSQK